MIVFRGKYIEKKDDFYLEEVENLTIGKSYKILKEHKPKNVPNGEWFAHCYIIVDDNNSVCTVSAKHFWTLEEWRNIKLNNLGI
jgi:hypothetical protein